MPIFPVAPGNPNYGSDSTNKYIASLYSSRLIKKFYPTTVWGECSNTDYESEIKSQGDTIYIRSRPTIETFGYKKGMVLPVQTPESPYTELRIDQAVGFSFIIDKIDEFQSDINLFDEWSADGAEQMKQVIDRKVLEYLCTGACLNDPAIVGTYTTSAGTSHTFGTLAGDGTDWSVATAGSIGALGNKIISRIIEYGQVLDENNIPEQDRFVILPAWAMAALKQSDLKAVYLTGDGGTPLRNGKVGMIDRFKLFQSNNLYKANDSESEACTGVIFGHKYATTFATQITESRIIDNPYGWGRLMQALQVYGFNVIKPDAIGIDFVSQFAKS